MTGFEMVLLLHFFSADDIIFHPLFLPINDVKMCLFVCAYSTTYRTNCFELFGMDVILDHKLEPSLLEVNVSPSLMGSSPLDKRIKGGF